MIRVRNQYIVAGLLLLALVAVVFGCTDDDQGPIGPGDESGNAPVGIPTADNNVSLSPTLQWHPVGDWGDSVVYDLYFGQSATPSATFPDLADTSYAPGPLEPGTQYRWAVRAKINGTITAWSTVHSFGSRSSITYPVEVGNRWEYRRELTALSTVSGYFLLEVVGTDTGWQVNPVYVFEETWFDLDQVTLNNSTTWYHVTNDGLYLVGYDGPGNIIPASLSTSYRYRFGGREFESVSELLGQVEGTGVALSPRELIVEDPPKLGLEYPISIGAEWVFREDDPWRIEKQIHDFEIISVPAGNFGCFVVSWLEDTNNDGSFNDNLVFLDYIAEEGLVRRSILMANVLVVDEHGNELGFIDITDEYELVAWE
ncbi:MAG: hypothetical protein J7J98_07855 [candidate division Zixibacteria bacterium]|nr:hypothetical protein [candidate division Zixibacteria bacterium]